MSNKVKVPGGAFYVGDGLTVDQTTRTVSAGGGSSVSTPDWNQNDATASDYIKNRPFYTGDPAETVLVEESTVEFVEDSGSYGAFFPTSFNAKIGATYKVSWDGSIYTCVCKKKNNLPMIGNQSIIGFSPDTGEPFIIFNQKGLLETGWASATTDTSASHTISISGLTDGIVKIDDKYLPDSIISGINYAQNVAESAQSTAESAQSTAESAQSTVDGCVKINNSGNFKINLDDNSFFSGSSSTGTPYYRLGQKNISDTPIVLSIGANGGTGLEISVTPSTSPTVKIKPPVYLNKQADIEIVRASNYPAAQITGLGGITMYSSTSGSTKIFKITVDDSGTISTTEVTA